MTEPQSVVLEQDELEIDLRHYFSVLRRRINLILAVTLAAGLAALLISTRLPRTYEGVVLLSLERPETEILTQTDTIFTRTANLNALIESQPVRDLAAAKLAQAGLASLVDNEKAKPRSKSLGQDITRLSGQAPSSQVAAAVANAFASALVETDLNSRRASSRNARRFIESQVDQTQVRLARAESALAAFRERIGRRTRVVTQPDGTRQAVTVPLSPSEAVVESRLARDLRVAEENYLFLTRKLQEARIKEASIAPGLRVLQRAETPTRPISPRTRVNIAIALLLGLMGGVGLALVLESLDERLRDADEVERVANLPVLAELPYLPPRNRTNSDSNVGLVLLEDPHSLLSEAYRLLRSVVIFELAQRKIKTLIVTSPWPEQGKTTVCANLAVGLALAGKLTALIEADLRRPRLETLFSSNGEYPNLLGLLNSNDKQPVLQQTGVNNLLWLPAGGSHPESTELLSSDQLPRTLGNLKGQVDIVVVDAPPALAVSDALILGRFVDTILLVVESGVTTRSDLRSTLKRLAHAGIPVLGVVMNKVLLEPGQQRYYTAYYKPTDSKTRPAESTQTSGATEKRGETA